MATKIRRSDDGSFAEMMEWLEQEYEESDGEGFDGFWCNRGMIHDAHVAGDLSVLFDGDEVVAFLAMDDMRFDILQVRSDMRGRGHGGKLARHYIGRARRKNIGVLRIECNPWASIPFWKKMGFTLFPSEEETRNEAYMVLDRSFVLPSDCPPVNVSIAFYPLSEEWERQTESVITHSPAAVRVGTDEIMLSDRIICFDPYDGLRGNSIVGIEVDGKTIYSDEIRYPEAEKVGVQRDNRGIYYLDRIRLPSA